MQINRTTWLSILILPLAAGLLARIVLFYDLWHSPIRYYSRLIGLDMQSNLILGGWLYNGFSVFTIHKFIIAAVMFFNHGEHCPEAVILIQMLLGLLVGPLTAWCCWQLTGKRLWAGASGVTAALYAPALLHECLTLRESTQIFLAVLSLAGVILARRTRYNNYALFLCGTGLALPCLVRISSLPFLGLALLWPVWGLVRMAIQKKISFRLAGAKVGLIAGGIAVIFLPVSLFNYFRADTFLPFHLDTKYAVAVGKQQAPTTMNIAPATEKTAPTLGKSAENTPTQSKIISFAINFCEKLPLLFKPFEIANNVNYYFMKYKLFPLAWLPGPLLVIPLAVSGMLLIIISWQWWRRESILLLYIISYSLPLAFFFPLARYRLIMYPVFCILMFYPVFAAKFWQRKTGSILPLLLVIIVTAGVFLLTFPKDFPLRATDFIAYGKAAQFQQGKLSPAAAEYFAAAIATDPGYAPGYINLADSLLQNRQPDMARQLLEPAMQRFPANDGIKYYYALALLNCGRAAQAEQILRKTAPSGTPDQHCQYWYHFGESLRLQGKIKEAAAAYRQALESANPGQREIINRLLDKISSGNGTTP